MVPPPSDFDSLSEYAVPVAVTFVREQGHLALQSSYLLMTASSFNFKKATAKGRKSSVVSSSYAASYSFGATFEF